MRMAMYILAGVLALTGCQRAATDRVQGYVEGEFVYVASPLAGALESLPVRRGSQTKADDLLFAIESGSETAARDEAARRLEEGKSRLTDARKGLRASEIAALDARRDQAKAAMILADKEFVRQSELAAARIAAVDELDRARAARDLERHRVEQAEADLQTAGLGSRSDQIAAEEANVRALQAALAKAEWDLSQKRQAAPAAGLIFDTLYEQGEWVPAGRPVISLLPPGNIKVRAFVPETKIGTLKLGAPARVAVDGVGEKTGTIRFISPRAEYTPPVIYSQETRQKLVFMIEVGFEPDVAATLHPGQPVDVRF